MVILILYYNLINFCMNYCTDIMYLYLTCSISYGVNLYWDLGNVNKFKFLEVKGVRPAHKADNLTAICEPNV
jgi:hypothetical protein